MEMETTWEIEGHKQGLQEGMATMLEKHLHMRFGNLSPKTGEALQT